MFENNEFENSSVLSLNQWECRKFKISVIIKTPIMPPLFRFWYGKNLTLFSVATEVDSSCEKFHPK